MVRRQRPYPICFWKNYELLKRTIQMLFPVGNSLGRFDQSTVVFQLWCMLEHMRVTSTSLSLISHSRGPPSLVLNPISAGGGLPPPPGFSLAIATKINRSTPNFLTFNFYYWDIIWPKIQVHNLSGGHVITLFTVFSQNVHVLPFLFSDIYI